jgi:hypothetical protein
MDDDRQRIDALAVERDVELHQLAAAMLDVLVIEAGVAARQRFELVEEVEMISESGSS